MTPEQIEEHQKRIDGMSRYEMCNLWRYAPSGHPYFDKREPLFEHFKKRFDELGGFSPQISKRLG